MDILERINGKLDEKSYKVDMKLINKVSTLIEWGYFNLIKFVDELMRDSNFSYEENMGWLKNV